MTTRARFLRISLFSLIAPGLVAIASPGTALADGADSVAVKELFNDAMAGMKAGNYTAACPKLEKASELDKGALNVLSQLAKCYEGAGKLASAYGAYVRLEVAARAAHDTRFDIAIAAAAKREQALDEKVGKLTISLAPGTESAAVVRRDGVALKPAELGLPFPVDAGEHEVNVDLAGHASWSKKLTVNDGARETVTAEAGAALPGQVETPAPPKPAAVPPPPVVPAAPPVDTPKQPGSFWSGARIGGLATAVVGVGVLGAGAGVGIHGKSLFDQSNAAGHCSTITNRCSAQADRDLRDKAVLFGNVGTGLFVGGGVVAGVGIIVFAVAPRAKAETKTTGPQPRLALRITPGGLGFDETF